MTTIIQYYYIWLYFSIIALANQRKRAQEVFQSHMYEYWELAMKNLVIVVSGEGTCQNLDGFSSNLFKFEIWPNPFLCAGKFLSYSFVVLQNFCCFFGLTSYFLGSSNFCFTHLNTLNEEQTMLKNIKSKQFNLCKAILFFRSVVGALLAESKLFLDGITLQKFNTINNKVIPPCALLGISTTIVQECQQKLTL